MKIGFITDEGTFPSDGGTVIGRQVANTGLVRSLMRYGDSNLFAFSSVKALNKFAPESSGFDVAAPPHKDLGEILRWADIALVPSPILSGVAAIRMTVRSDESQCRIVGLTHALHTARVKNEFRKCYPTISSRDAIVCTSEAARYAVANLRGSTSSRGPMPLSIPLGVDSSELPSLENRALLHDGARHNFNIDPNTLLLLYLGRIDYTSKAHFVSLFRFAERLAACSERRVTLLLVGWFPSRLMARQILTAAPNLAPSVETKHLDGRLLQEKRNALLAADACVFPADNIQESFGIVPLEAMCSGIPLAVSDWNGYRDTVLGCSSVVRMKTIYPWAPVAEKLHKLHDEERIDDVRLIASLACLTAVDHIGGAERLASLLSDPIRSERAAADTAARVASSFDWSVVAKSYVDKFHELLLNSSAAENFNPLGQNSSNPFRHFASEALTDDTILLTDEAEIASIAPFALFSETLRVLPDEIFSPLVLQEVYRRLLQERRVKVGRLLEPDDCGKNIRIMSAVSVLLKWGLLRTGTDGEY